jgi:hypothetical protein
MGKLAEALKTKFRTPQDAIKALGLDASLLDEDSRKRIAMDSIALSPKAMFAKGYLLSRIKPRLATDAKIDLDPILEGITERNFHAKRPVIEAALKIVTRNKLAQDADLDDLDELLGAIEEVKSRGAWDESEEEEKDKKEKEEEKAEDESEEEKEEREKKEKAEDESEEEEKEKAEDESEEEEEKKEKEKSAEDARKRLGRDETEEECKEREAQDKRARDARRAADRKRRAADRKRAEDKKRARDNPPPFKGMPETGGTMVTKDAMDSAIAIKLAERDEQHKHAREAEKFVRPYVGELAMAYDTAEEVYKAALKILNVNVDGVHPSAYRVILDNMPKPGARKERELGMDAASSKSFAERFPESSRIEVM